VNLPLENCQYQGDGAFEPLQSREQRREGTLLSRPLQARLKWNTRTGGLGGGQRGQRCFQFREQEHCIGKYSDELVDLDEGSTPHWDGGKILNKAL
jgi:hypothetical protein